MGLNRIENITVWVFLKLHVKFSFIFQQANFSRKQFNKTVAVKK